MNEYDVMTATQYALRSRGYWPYHPTDGISCPKCHSTIVPQSKGRPDLLISHPAGISAVCEVKDVNHAKGENALYFKEISPEQREWLTNWDNAAGDQGIGAFISIGLILPAGSRTTLECIWILPWKKYQEIEEQWADYEQAGVGISPSLYKRAPKVFRELFLDEYPGMDIYKIYRKKEENGKVGWQMSDEHPLAKGHDVQKIYFKEVKNES